MSNSEVMKQVCDGYRLPKPAECPELMYTLMMRCWNEAPENRPDFAQILEFIQKEAVPAHFSLASSPGEIVGETSPLNGNETQQNVYNSL